MAARQSSKDESPSGLILIRRSWNGGCPSRTMPIGWSCNKGSPLRLMPFKQSHAQKGSQPRLMLIRLSCNI
eukprot:1160514-Pelagomonas_calceolata.AAC.2